MRVTVSGATGLIGGRLLAALRDRGDELTVLSRDPERARAALPGIETAAWSLAGEPAPADALAGRDAVIHLAGENIAQRWTPAARERIRASRERGTADLVAGIEAAQPRPRALVCASGVGYYGPRGDELLDEQAPAGEDFVAAVCVAWEHAAGAARELGVRVVNVRTGVVLDRAGGALRKMLPPFRLGVGGPVAGGRQYMSWVHIDDVAGIYAVASADERWEGAVNASAPEPVTNAEFSRALGRALRRPAVMPVPAAALRALYGEMASIVTGGQRAVPRRALALGYEFRHTDLDEALRAALR